MTGQQGPDDELRWRAELFDQLFDAVVVWDWPGTITFWNAGAEHIYGFSSAEAIGRSIHDLLHTDHRQGVSSFLQQLETRKQWSAELLHTSRDGRQIMVETRMRLVRGASGPYVIETNHDVTERRQAVAKIQELNASLERRVRELEATTHELEAFSYSVSHELRAPLRGIDSFSRIVIEDYGQKLDGEGRRQLNVIRDEAQRMGRLIDELLTFSRLGRQDIRSVPIDMTSLVQSVLNELPAAVRERGDQIQLTQLPGAFGDHAMVRQVLVNLISNALKFSAHAEAPAIEISGDAVDGISTYRVKDNGVGFDPRYTAKLFGVFQRLHSEEEFEGTGVGLAIVQRIVHRHGGKVAAEGTLNHGATFSFTLPDGNDEYPK